ncbi:MAG TPA: outer membrane beta-barrel protein [Chitinophaga sp.]|uniref:outer membrane beta-barrel protein n=1 Tax=Chitinophaga sp. TaxID=1869181 RepID=UPI002DB9940B|nr:outer membrane beta-barrel protein [Chitinophaga sp.]HEU4552717.1 outer membrane beta-barrel protein [Chitinophaga sp.]
MKGHIRDSAGNALPGAVITLVADADSMGLAVDTTGGFIFNNVQSSRFTLKASFIGYKTFIRQYHVADTATRVLLDNIILADAQTHLGEIVVRATVPVKVKEDTIEYDAKAFRVREGDAVEEIVKKLPGMEVDKNGNMTVQGEAITRVKLNGKDFFGDDAAAAIQNLPADIVKNLQVIDDYGDKAAVTGIKGATSQKILNINLEPDKERGYYGKATAGAGTAGRYLGRVQSNILRGNRQIAIDGGINNTERGDGISERKSIKANYRDNWGQALESYGSYRYNNRQQDVIAATYSQSIFQDYTKTEDEDRNSHSGQQQHQLSWNLEYRLDSNNYLKVQPNIGYNVNASHTTGLAKTFLLGGSSVKDNQSFGNATSSDIGTTLFYNHKFRKHGRNLSLDAKISASGGDNYSDITNRYTITDSSGNVTDEDQLQRTSTSNKVVQTNVEASYIEPLSASSYAVLEYEWGRSGTENIRNTNDVDPASGEQKPNLLQSNNYNYQFITHRIGLTYQFRHEKLKYMLGMSAQPSLLKGQDISRGIATSRHMFNLVPVARLVYRFSRKKTFTARYYGRSQAPGFTQLQPITDNSDLQNTITGNPDLKPEFSNNISLEYKQSDWSSGYTMLTKLTMNQTRNKIVSTRVIVADSLKEKTSYVNTNGFYFVKGFYTFSKPFAGRKYVLTYFGNAGISNNIAFTNEERNIGKDLDIRQGLKFRLDLEEVADVELNTAYTFNSTSYSSAAFEGRQVHSIFIGLGGRNYFFSNWTLGYNLSQTINNGYNTGNANPTLLNVYVERRFLKGHKAAVRLAAFDLFNENTGITRDVFDNQIVDRQNNRLARYFMLSFNYRLEDFGG